MDDNDAIGGIGVIVGIIGAFTFPFIFNTNSEIMTLVFGALGFIAGFAAVVIVAIIVALAGEIFSTNGGFYSGAGYTNSSYTPPEPAPEPVIKPIKTITKPKTTAPDLLTADIQRAAQEARRLAAGGGQSRMYIEENIPGLGKVIRPLDSQEYLYAALHQVEMDHADAIWKIDGMDKTHDGKSFSEWWAEEREKLW